MTRIKQHLVDAFYERFGASKRPLYYAAAPGRVNLLGEHTDYNDGFVLPLAVEQEVNIVASPRRDALVRAYSLNYREWAELTLTRLAEETSGWVTYVRGVLLTLQNAGYGLRGMDLVVCGDVPAGAGLSSSAAFQVAVLLAASAVGGFSVEPTEAAKLVQKAENEVVGVQCGIMDMFASRLGRRDAALLLDCRSLEYQLVPLGDPSVRLLIVNSNVQRGLVDSAYNQRRKECEEAARLLGVPALRDVSVETFDAKADRLPEAVRRRARHVVEENERVLAAVEHLKSGDVSSFGQAMWASHTSLRDLFEVSCPELDVLVEIARSVPGVLGSRMTGAGFGGCTVTLVRADALKDLQQAILTDYPARTGLRPDLYPLSMEGAGAFVQAIE